MTMGPEPMSRILRRSVRFGMVAGRCSAALACLARRGPPAFFHPTGCRALSKSNGGPANRTEGGLYDRSDSLHDLRWIAFPERHVALQKIEKVPFVFQVLVAAGVELGDGLFVAPAVVFHAVDSAERPGAMDACEAVDEDGEIIGVVHDLEEAADADFSWDRAVRRPPRARRNADVIQAFGQAVVFFGEVGRRLIRGSRIAQGDHGLDATLVHRGLKAGNGHLAAAIQDTFTHRTEVAYMDLPVMAIAPWPG